MIELIVSVAILVVLMAMIGMIFNLSSQTSSQATAVTGVQRQLRMVREMFQQDLGRVTPERSCLAIAAVLVSTYETAGDRANGKLSKHRADLLMFFTDRSSAPYADPLTLGTDPRAPVQIVYGHANLDKLDPASPNVAWLGPRRLVESMAMNASDWHLARRAVLFDNVSTTTLNDPGFTSTPVLEGVTDVATLAGGGIPPFVAQPFNYEANVAGVGFLLLPGYRTIIRNWFYNPPAVPGRTVLDPTPPEGKAAQMAYQFLPGCADFKVEYTYDDPTDATAIAPTRWIDPLQAADNRTATRAWMEWLGGSPDTLYPGNPPGNAAPNPSPDRAFVNNTANFPADPFGILPGPTVVKVRTWPRALRITMRVYDRRGFLAERTVPDPANLDGSGRGYRYEPTEFVYVHTF